MNAQRAADALELRLLGPLELLVGGEPVPLGPPKQRALLAQLALRAGEAVPVERLVDELWPEDPPESARHAVQVYVSRLRKALGDPARVVARSRAYALVPGPGCKIDLEHFRSFVAEAREKVASDPAGAAYAIGDALGLWRGRALADLDGEPAVRDLVLELEEERLAAQELRFEAELAAGASGELIADLERLIAQHPAREQLRGFLMLALYRSGRQQDALAAYRQARSALREELGLEPGPKLRELEAAILRQDPSLLVESAELRARRHLPAQPNAFIGREQELRDLVRLFASGGARLVTVTGTGGIGKTRLALAAAEQLAARFRDGVWFVDLAGVGNPAVVVTAIAAALRLEPNEAQTAESALADYVHDRELLLVVDNFEHLLDAAKLLSRLLKESPRLMVLVTSRAPLRLYGEHAYDLPGLELPELASLPSPDELAQCESVALFRERARAVRTNFELDLETSPPAAEICVRLDGLPLAIELAAARLNRLTLNEVREGLARALDLLSEGPRDVADRQRTLRATIAWSYDLLPQEEQRTCTRLAIFSGGATASAALDVCGATQDALDSLVRNGLLRHEIAGSTPRVSMLATIRAYALEQLRNGGELEALAWRHAEWYLALAEEGETHLGGGEADSWFATLEAESDNFRAALAWAEAASSDLLMRLATSLANFWALRGHAGEGAEWLKRSLTSDASASLPLRAKALRGAAAMAYYRGAMAQAEELWSQSRDLLVQLGDEEAAGRVAANLALIAIENGELERAERITHEALRLLRAHVGGRQTGRATTTSGVIARALNNLGLIALMRRDYAQAETRLAEALSVAEQVEDREQTGLCLFNLALLACKTGDLQDSAGRLAQASSIGRRIDSDRVLAYCFEGFGALALSCGDPRRAARLLGAAEAVRHSHGLSLDRPTAETHRETVSGVKAQLGAAEFAAAWDSGAALGKEGALAEGLDVRPDSSYPS
jgi:predicted ATPase/DNA-binding SARP family transcriptional activator